MKVKEKEEGERGRGDGDGGDGGGWMEGGGGGVGGRGGGGRGRGKRELTNGANKFRVGAVRHGSNCVSRQLHLSRNKIPRGVSSAVC